MRRRMILCLCLALLLSGCALPGGRGASSAAPSSQAGLATTPPAATQPPASTAKPTAMPTAAPRNAADLLGDGDFTGGVPDTYGLYLNGGEAQMSGEDGELTVRVTNWGDQPYAVQVNRNGFQLEKGVAYKLAFDARSTLPRLIEVCVQRQGGDWEVFHQWQVEVGASGRRFELEFTAASDDPGHISFNMGLVGDPADVYEEHAITLDNIQLLAMGEAKEAAPTQAPLSAWEEFAQSARRSRGYSVDLTGIKDGSVDIWFGDAASVELDVDGTATLLWTDGQEDFLAENVLLVYPVAYGNGGMGAVFLVMEDGSVDLVDPSAMMNHQARTYPLDGLREIKTIFRATEGEWAGLVVAQDISGEETALDDYIILD